MKKILISGYYGFDNAGDEAVLQAILDAIKEETPYLQPIVLSGNPNKTKELYQVEAINRYNMKEVMMAMKHADGLISGGGSLLQDETGKFTIPYYMGIIFLANFYRKPTFIYSQGIGPVNRRMFYPLIRAGFNKSTFISVRDKQSALLLEKMDIPKNKINIITDPVLGLRPINREQALQVLEQEGIKDAPILISVRFWKENKHYLHVISEFADQFIKLGEEVVFLPMHEPSDREAAAYVIERMQEREKARIIGEYDARTIMGIIGESKCLVGMRLHSLIFAVAVGTPAIGISYDPKIDSFLGQINQAPVGSTEDLEFRTLFDQVKHTLYRLNENKEELEQIVPKLKEQAKTPAKAIAAFFSK